MSAEESKQVEAHFNETLKVLGNFWALRLIDVLSSGPLRFCELERALGDSNPTTLTRQLKKLEDGGYILKRTLTEEHRQVLGYQLQEKGRLAIPVIEALKTMSQKSSSKQLVNK